jgi:hypothetical protein
MNKLAATEENLDALLSEKLDDVKEEIKEILKNKQREKSDLQNQNMKLVNGIKLLS